jgi:alkylhydroperoxidase/carboxymuconolactone decarboxylase family protein YurZ
VTERESSAAFLGMGVDLSTDTFTAEEKARTLEWYREYHDHGELDLAPFARFTIEHDPTGFKRQRRHVIALGEPVDDAPLPLAAALLAFIHTYIVLGMGKGALYETITVRGLGVSRAEILETIALASLHGGPRGINALAEVADEYLREWPEDDGVSGIDWPDGWAPDIGAFRSGIDLGSDELLPGELELLRDWYRRAYGEVPAHVDFLARVAPGALKTQRARFETAVRGALPAQLIPLLSLHLSAVRLWPKPLRRAVQLARALGVARGQVVTALLWAAVYGADIVMETAFDAAGDVLDAWEDQGVARIPPSTSHAAPLT